MFSTVIFIVPVLLNCKIYTLHGESRITGGSFWTIVIIIIMIIIIY